MARVQKRAKELKVGDVLDAARGHGVMSIHEIWPMTNKAMGSREIKIRGPFGYIDVMHEDQMVTVLEGSQK